MSDVTTTILIFVTAMKLFGMVSPGKDKGDVKFYVSKKEQKATMQTVKIAVLPLDNTSTDGNAPRKLLSSITNFIASTGVYDVIDPGQVEKALLDLRIRNTGGLDAETANKLASALKCHGFLVGTIVDFGDVRVGNESIPTLSVNLRFLDARTGNIVWAGSITLSGGSSSSLFGSTKVVSLTKLVQVASKKIAEDLFRKRKEISLALKSPETPVVSVTPGKEVPSTPSSPTPQTVSVETTPAEAPSFQEKVLAEADLQKIFVDLNGFVKGEMVSRVVFYPEVQADYSKEDKFIRLKAVDYKKTEKAKLFIAKYFSGAKPVQVAENITGYLMETENGNTLLGFSAGQIGLYLQTGNKNAEELVPAAKHVLQSVSSILK